jgi:hypothetical protein
MGERVYVTLTVLSTQFEQAKAILTKYNGNSQEEYSAQGSSDEFDVSWLGYEEVNYGELGGLPDLVAIGIAYDSRWEQGSEFGRGFESVRFTAEGEAIKKVLYDHDEGIKLDKFRTAMALAKPEERLIALEAVISEHEARLFVLPLDEKQIEYGKVFRTKRLLQIHSPISDEN